MEAEKPKVAVILTFFGAALMLLNSLIVALNQAPLMVSSGPVSPETLIASDAPFWWRISFGFLGFVESPLGFVWVAFSILVLLSAIMLYLKPLRRKILGLTIIVFSALTLPAGGGFILGLILAIIGGGIAFEWPKPAKETFFGRLLRAARIDPELFSTVAVEPKVLRQSALVIILVNLLSGLGIGLYAFNVGKILAPDTPAPTSLEIIYSGRLIWDISILAFPIVSLGVAVVKWIFLSVILYVVGVKIIGSKAELEQIARAVAFAYVPIALQFFMVFVFTSKPYLPLTWPIILFLVTNLWMIIALIVAIKSCLEITLNKSIGTVFLGGSLYWLTNYVFIVKAFGAPGNMEQSIPVFPLPMLPGSIQILIQPPELALLSISILITLATVLGVFSKR
jgi:hypothetical protein